MFFVGQEGALGALGAAVLLLGLLVLSMGVTLAVSRLLSATVLRGVPSSYTLELPPYRMNQNRIPRTNEESIAGIRAWQQIFDGDSFLYIVLPVRLK